jgi:predicted nucleotidyltransferase
MPTCRNMGDHLWVEAGGTFSLKSMLATIHEVAEHCRQENLNKVLVDLRTLHGDPNIFERYLLGLEIARVWGHKIRAAIVVRPEISSRMAENTAVNRGARIRVKTHLDEALEWLEIDQEQEHA